MQTAQTLRFLPAQRPNRPTTELSALWEADRLSKGCPRPAVRKRRREAAIIAITAKLSEDAAEREKVLGEFFRQAIQKNSMLVRIGASPADSGAKLRKTWSVLKRGASED